MGIDTIAAVERADDPVREFPGAQALRRGLSLLDLVAQYPGLRFTELADRSGLTKAIVHRMLATLVEAGLIRVHERDQGYHLGFRLFEMAHRVWVNPTCGSPPNPSWTACGASLTRRCGLIS